MSYSPHPMISELIALNEDKARVSKRNADFAQLRRGLAHPGEHYGAFDAVERFVVNQNDFNRKCHYVVAGLFALHPLHSTEKFFSLGKSFAWLKRERKEAESVTRRFQALLNAHPDDLAGHLRQAFSLFKSDSIPVNYDLLLRQLQGWGNEEKKTQLQWARDFWRDSNAGESAAASPEFENLSTHVTTTEE